MTVRRFAAFAALALTVQFGGVAVRGQPQTQRLGILAPTSTQLPPYGALRKALRDLGYEDGRNLVIIERAADGKAERLNDLAAELVGNNVDVILAPGAEATLHAARQATHTIPIVMVAIDYDPVELRYVTSLGRPGGNITGVFLRQLELNAKRLEIVKEAIPGAQEVAVLWDRFSTDQWRGLQSPAASIGIRLRSLELSGQPYDYEKQIQSAAGSGSDALLVLLSPVFYRDRVRLSEIAAKHRLPTMFGLREWPDSGGLMSYGANISDMYVRAVTYIDKILKGTHPANLPVEQPTKLELVVNVRVAKALGLAIPRSIMLRADQVID